MSILRILAAFDKRPSISTDTRRIQPGDLFFALKGANFNGNRFAAQALEAGASIAVVDEAEVIPEGDDRYLLVEDVLQALQDSSRAYRKRFNFPFIGITGTNGKTTTKELLYAVVATEKKVHATKGNLNNHIGVPLTLFALPTDTEVAIIEMGANKLGDIAELSAIACPTHGMITNIGYAHLERFGDIDGVKQTKGELFDFLRAHEGWGFINVRDERVTARAEGLERRTDFGGDEAPYRILQETHLPYGMTLEIQLGDKGPVAFESKLVGTHNAENVLAAVTVGDQLGISVESLQKGIRDYVPNMNRSQIIQQGELTLLLDAYNANPSSMEAALKTAASQNYGRIGLILGDMFELGESSEERHRHLVKQARELLPEAVLIGVGTAMMQAVAELDDPAPTYPDVNAAKEDVAKNLEGMDFILVKGSRGVALEKVLPALGISL